MLGIALNLGCEAIFNRDQHAASIGTIVRARGVDNFLHDSFDYTGLSGGRAEAAQ
jgi:hypothetical protein